MKRVLATLFVSTVAAVLAIYSAMRSLDFIQITLPPEQASMGYLALIATEGGIFCWLLYFLYGAEGSWQRGIALVMTVIDLLGSIGLFTADTLLRSGERGLVDAMTAEEIKTVILGLSGLIALNVAATVACHLFDPENRKKAAEQEAFSKLEDATLEAISKDADTLAATLAPVVAADWIATTRTRYTAALGTGAIPSAATVIDARAKEPAEQPQAKPTHTTRRATPRPYMGKRRTAQPADPGLVAAVLAALAATQPAQPAPVTYQAETAGTPPLSVAGDAVK